MTRKLKVFHGLVNYGTQAGYLSKTLRKFGIKSKSVVTYDSFIRTADITLINKGTLSNYLRNRYLILKSFFEFNIFHFYYGTSLFHNQWDLPFYKLFGKKIVMHYLGNDVQEYEASVQKYKWTNMGLIKKAEEGRTDDSQKRKRLRFESKYVDCKLVCAPCYSEFVPGSSVLPLALDLEEFGYCKHPANKILQIMHAPTHRGNKGTKYIISAVENLKSKGYNLNLNLVENVSHKELKEQYKKCDLFIDQLLAGWYGTASVEAMAIGRPVICSIRKSYFNYIDFAENIPIVHADPDNILDAILFFLNNPQKLPEIGRTSRKFVEKIHDENIIAKKLIKIYENL